MDIKDVESLALLARLELSMEEKEAMLKDMVEILGYIKQIEGVDVDNITPFYGTKNVWREDEISTRNFSNKIITEQFPASKDGFLKVKKIL